MASDAIPFTPKFRKYPAIISYELGRIAESLGAIRSARILPAIADQLRSSALAGTVHFSNMIEGNELPLVEAERAARRQLSPTTRSKIELINYVAALDLIDARISDGTFELTPKLLLDIHREATRGLGRTDDPHFKPHHEGAWRDGEAVVFDHLTGQILHAGTSPARVEGEILGVFEWLEQRWDSRDWPPFILAGVVHHAITETHPFADGNGRTARLFQAALLMHADVLPGRMFSFEKYYASDKNAYLNALRSVGKNTGNMEEWLEYFVRGLAEEYERVAVTVGDLNLFAGHASGKIQLSQHQQEAFLVLRMSGKRVFTRREYESAARVGRSTALDDLRGLVQSGLISAVGAGPQTRYEITNPERVSSSPPGGRPKTWTDARIEKELRALVGNHNNWPTRQEFQKAGRVDLYTAASRNGGIRRWRRVLGV